MVRSSSPGVLDGDDYHWKIEVAKGCSLELVTQSYQRIFQMECGAKQQVEVRLEEGSSCSYLPHPAVPHGGSTFFSKNTIHLSDNCTLLWSEIITCGRKLTGEAFRFSSYHSITEIFLNHKLVVKENLLMRPSATNYLSIGHLEGYSHCASLLFINEQTLITDLIKKLRCHLLAVPEISYGVSALPVNGLIVRLLGHKGEQLFDCINDLAAIITLHQSSINTQNSISYAG
ncbi:MAG TPA: urease accessory protein UreD [Flavisolibacter sp.]|nr:urease accessory protein UreD [Flavisolibacter sp.]